MAEIESCLVDRWIIGIKHLTRSPVEIVLGSVTQILCACVPRFKNDGQIFKVSDKIGDLLFSHKMVSVISTLESFNTAPSSHMTAHSNSNRPRSRSQPEKRYGAAMLEYFSKWDDGFIKEYENVASKPLISFMERKYSAFSIIPIHAGYDGNAIFPVILVVAKDFSDEGASELIELFTTLRCKIIQRIFCFDAQEQDWIDGRSEKYDDDDDDEMSSQSRSFQDSPCPGAPLGLENEEHISTLGVYVKLGAKKDIYAITMGWGLGKIAEGDASKAISPTVVHQPPALDMAYQRDVLLKRLKVGPSGDKVTNLLRQVSKLDSLKTRFGEVWLSRNEVSNVGDHKLNVNYSLIKVDESRMSRHLVPILEDRDVEFCGGHYQKWSTGFTPLFPRCGSDCFALRSYPGPRGTVMEQYTHAKLPWSPVTTSEYTIYGIRGEPFSHRADCGTPVIDGKGKCFGLISGQVSGVPKKNLSNHGSLSPINVSYVTPISAILYHIWDTTGSEVTMLVDSCELVENGLAKLNVVGLGPASTLIERQTP